MLHAFWFGNLLALLKMTMLTMHNTNNVLATGNNSVANWWWCVYLNAVHRAETIHV